MFIAPGVVSASPYSFTCDPEVQNCVGGGGSLFEFLFYLAIAGILGLVATCIYSFLLFGLPSALVNLLSGRSWNDNKGEAAVERGAMKALVSFAQFMIALVLFVPALAVIGFVHAFLWRVGVIEVVVILGVYWRVAIPWWPNDPPSPYEASPATNASPLADTPASRSASQAENEAISFPMGRNEVGDYRFLTDLGYRFSEEGHDVIAHSIEGERYRVSDIGQFRKLVESSMRHRDRPHDAASRADDDALSSIHVPERPKPNARPARLMEVVRALTGVVIIIVRQYDGGPWWARVYPARSAMISFLKLEAPRPAIATVAELVAAASPNAFDIADRLYDSGIEPIAAELGDSREAVAEAIHAVVTEMHLSVVGVLQPTAQ